MNNFLFVLIIASLGYLTSCSQEKNELPEFHNWKGGAVKEPGIYYYKDKNLQLTVRIDNKLLKYEMVDSSGNELFRNGQITASALHKWAFYLDDDKNLWCLSSDLGHVEWKFDPLQKTYLPIKFYHDIDRDDVPAALYRDLKEFFD